MWETRVAYADIIFIETNGISCEMLVGNRQKKRWMHYFLARCFLTISSLMLKTKAMHFLHIILMSFNVAKPHMHIIIKSNLLDFMFNATNQANSICLTGFFASRTYFSVLI